MRTPGPTRHPLWRRSVCCACGRAASSSGPVRARASRGSRTTASVNPSLPPSPARRWPTSTSESPVRIRTICAPEQPRSLRLSSAQIRRSVGVGKRRNRGVITLRKRSAGMAYVCFNRNRGPVPRTGVAGPGLPAAKSQATGTCLAWRLPLKCHSPEGGTRFHIRKVLTTWSPLTESNRRPSPYHVSLCSSAAPGRAADLREHEHTLALTSTGRAHASSVCHSICHSL